MKHHLLSLEQMKRYTHLGEKAQLQNRWDKEEVQEAIELLNFLEDKNEIFLNNMNHAQEIVLRMRTSFLAYLKPKYK